MIEVVRHRQDDLVAGIGDREHGVHERLVAARGHEDAALRPDRDAVLARELGLDRLDERGQPLDRPVSMVGQRCRRTVRAASIASRGGSYETTPCPSEIVPGVSAVQRPTMGMTGAWTASRRRD